MFKGLLEEWDGEDTVIRYDKPTGAWIFICIHSTICGPAFGGTRMRVYSDPDAALAEAMLLSEAMTKKNAVLGVPLGGGKAVIAVPEIPQRDQRRELLLRYGAMLESLGGAFSTANDMNISVPDLDVVSEKTSWVYGISQVRGGSGETGPTTARGVFYGIQASLKHKFGSESIAGHSVHIQGVGSVGLALAELLVAGGARLILSDINDELVRAVASRLGAEVVPLNKAMAVECDVFSPCAIPGILNDQTISELRCQIVAGAANSQLGSAAAADQLHAAGILYAPDYIINAAGVLHIVAHEMLVWDPLTLEDRLMQIGTTLCEIYEEAHSAGVSTEEVARRLVEARLADAATEKLGS